MKCVQTEEPAFRLALHEASAQLLIVPKLEIYTNLKRLDESPWYTDPHFFSNLPQPPRSSYCICIMTNIVFFGESGVGKSSIINMLCDGQNVAATSSGAGQCTLDAQGYPGAIRGKQFTFWDTVGLQAGDQAKAPGLKEAAALYRLLCNLEDGLSLLVLVMRAPRITDPTQKNWKLFQGIICQGKVPVVIVVTHLEQEDMDSWWRENAVHFMAYEMCPSGEVYRTYEAEGIHSDRGVACITATKGKRDFFQEEYDLSLQKLKRLVYETHLPYPWSVGRVQWYKTIVETIEVRNWFGCITRNDTLERKEEGKIRELVSKWKLTNDEAKEIMITLESALN